MNTATNAPTELTIGNETFQVSTLARSEWGPVQAHILANAKDPVVSLIESFNRARAAGLEISREDRTEMVAKAMAEARIWPPTPGTPAWFGLLETLDGGSLLVIKTILKKHQPAITDADIERLDGAATAEESRATLVQAFGPKVFAPRPALALAVSA